MSPLRAAVPDTAWSGRRVVLLKDYGRLSRRSRGGRFYIRARCSPGPSHTTLADATDRRRHAVVEQSIAEPKSAGLAHLPSGKFMADAAWLALTVLAHNLGRAVGLLAGGRLTRTTAATLRTTVFTMPARLVHPARRQRLRAPARRP